MNTQDRSMSLQSGQALAIDRHGFSTLYLAEGELLLRAPASWLGDTVVLAPPRRVAAPAALPCEEIESIVALGTAKIRLQHAESLLEKLQAAWNELRLGRPRLAAGVR